MQNISLVKSLQAWALFQNKTWDTVALNEWMGKYYSKIVQDAGKHYVNLQMVDALIIKSNYSLIYCILN